MKRKVLVSILAIAFFLSSTGFPVIVHICESTGQSSFAGCAMCYEVTKLPETESCCQDEPVVKNNDTDRFESVSSADIASCCFEKVDLHKISYDVSVFNLSNLFICEFDAVTVSSDLTSEQEITQILRNTDDLPPPSFGKSLLTSIHQLKIALPLS